MKGLIGSLVCALSVRLACAKRYKVLRPWLVFSTPVDKFNQKISRGVKCRERKITTLKCMGRGSI